MPSDGVDGVPESDHELFWGLLNAALKLPPAPDTLYHYTDSRGLHAILEKRQFFASEYRHLNDMKEVTEGWREATNLLCDFVGELVEKVRPKPWMPKPVLERLEALDLSRQDGWLNESNVYVASFSEDWDSLPQWRSYADDGHGYAIGVATRELTQRAVLQGFTLLQCTYGTEELRKHDKTFATQVGPILVTALQPLWEGDHTEKAVETSMHHINLFATALETVRRALAVSYKSESFSSEREWRFVKGLFKQPPKKELKFRPSRLGVTPFVYLQVEKTDFSRIILGPCTDKAGAKFGIEQLLKREGTTCEVAPSGASYRGK